MNQELVSKKAWQGFLNGPKIITQVKYSNKQLLIIGSGPWSQKIKSILNTNDNEIKLGKKVKSHIETLHSLKDYFKKQSFNNIYLSISFET